MSSKRGMFANKYNIEFNTFEDIFNLFFFLPFLKITLKLWEFSVNSSASLQCVF